MTFTPKSRAGRSCAATTGVSFANRKSGRAYILRPLFRKQPVNHLFPAARLVYFLSTTTFFTASVTASRAGLFNCAGCCTPTSSAAAVAADAAAGSVNEGAAPQQSNPKPTPVPNCCPLTASSSASACRNLWTAAGERIQVINKSGQQEVAVGPTEGANSRSTTARRRNDPYCQHTAVSAPGEDEEGKNAPAGVNLPVVAAPIAAFGPEEEVCINADRQEQPSVFTGLENYHRNKQLEPPLTRLQTELIRELESQKQSVMQTEQELVLGRTSSRFASAGTSSCDSYNDRKEGGQVQDQIRRIEPEYENFPGYQEHVQLPTGVIGVDELPPPGGVVGQVYYDQTSTIIGSPLPPCSCPDLAYIWENRRKTSNGGTGTAGDDAAAAAAGSTTEVGEADRGAGVVVWKRQISPSLPAGSRSVHQPPIPPRLVEGREELEPNVQPAPEVPCCSDEDVDMSLLHARNADSVSKVSSPAAAASTEADVNAKANEISLGKMNHGSTGEQQDHDGQMSRGAGEDPDAEKEPFDRAFLYKSQLPEDLTKQNRKKRTGRAVTVDPNLFRSSMPGVESAGRGEQDEKEEDYNIPGSCTLHDNKEEKRNRKPHQNSQPNGEDESVLFQSEHPALQEQTDGEIGEDQDERMMNNAGQQSEAGNKADAALWKNTTRTGSKHQNHSRSASKQSGTSRAGSKQSVARVAAVIQQLDAGVSSEDIRQDVVGEGIIAEEEELEPTTTTSPPAAKIVTTKRSSSFMTRQKTFQTF
ncbi:unnamed protein product [Amoebophrya sp. A120]|nr:unnamed protein product [Amoebophrya sp. A120]|eukprot:GSA120T00009806001.1